MERNQFVWLCKELFQRLISVKIKTYVFFIAMGLVEFGSIPHLQSIGFFCGDPKISYKYQGDTVESHVLILVTLIVPYLAAMMTEYFTKEKNKFDSERYEWLKESLRWYRQYILGLIFVFFITDVGKLLIGEPRPHFLDTCLPKEAKNCTNRYIDRYTCMNENESTYIIRDASKSFPSGHASISVYGSISLAWYLHNKCKSRSLLLMPVLQAMCMLWAMFCSLTRITDHRHHWWDVLAGSIIGIMISTYINGLFDRQKNDNKSHSTTETWSNETTDNGYFTAGRLLNVVADGKNPSLNL
ncbi:phospholipid phosphatase 1-like isoform X1 [Metopolophium dirhodum]|uniref:phospholipid phosphatase 1-like isoform X1 n=1 Tax=Metopolophium dirhodum TaxID=44670 RepID=UPI00298F4C6E|nr:phospholipid phosphatase 1-like isoform X1 [Metopolophium dirhodum]